MSTVIRVAVIDDHQLFREGVARILAESGFNVVAEGGSKDEALRIAKEQRPDIMLVNISMAGGGLGAVGEILELCPDQNIVMLMISEPTDDVTGALSIGVKGYVLKGVATKALAEILQIVAGGLG